MRQPHLSHLGVLASGLSLILGACLPTDTRPPPASVLVTASSDDAIHQGFTTDDGWHVEFTRFLTTLGRTSLDGDACNAYSEARYERLLDMQQPAPQKISLLHGLGQCDFSFGVVHPVWDSIIGTGVTAAEALTMQTAGTDKYTAPNGQPTGINTYVAGLATRGDERKAFAWSFRQDYTYKSCVTESDAGPPQGLNLQGQKAYQVDILVRGEPLFQTDVDSSRARLSFDPIALADSHFGNNDGQITLDELGLVPILVTGAAVTPGATDAGPHSPFLGNDAGPRFMPSDAGAGALDGSIGDYAAGDGGVPSVSTLEDFVYLKLFPRMVRYQDTGYCTSVVARVGRGR